LTLTDFFSNPTVAELAEKVQAARLVSGVGLETGAGEREEFRL